MAAAWTSGGGGVEWRRVGGAAGGVAGGARHGGVETRRKRAEVKPTARAREIYDMRAPRFFLTLVDPMNRFRTPVDCVGSVHLRLQQIYI